jgi:hypothetical protein
MIKNCLTESGPSCTLQIKLPVITADAVHALKILKLLISDSLFVRVFKGNIYLSIEVSLSHSVIETLAFK